MTHRFSARFATRFPFAALAYPAVTRVGLAAALVVTAVSACSSDPTPPAQSQAGSSSGGVSGGSGGSGGSVLSTAGSPAVPAGTAGTPSSAAGSGGASAGSSGQGGNGGATAGGGGAGGVSGGTGGTAGTGGVAPPPCMLVDTGGVAFGDVAAGPQEVQAESAVLSGTAAKASHLGVDYVDMVGGEGALTWLLESPDDGAYKITFRYTQMEGRDMALDANCTLASASLPFMVTGDWDTTFKADVSQSVLFRKGTNKLVLRTNGGSGPNFDKLILSRPTCDLKPGESTCEAEDALITGGGVVLTNAPVTYVDWQGKEGSLWWYLKAPAAGTYDITFHYAQKEQRDMDVTVNGTKVPNFPVLKTTPDWNVGWLGDVTITVALKAGVNSLGLATNGGSGPNFDKITLSDMGTGGAGGAGGL